MRKLRVFLAVLAVLLVAGISSAQTTMTLNGIIRVYPEMNNYGFGKINYSANSGTNSFVDQRARLFFNLKTGDNLGGTVAFEMDSRWGDRAYNNGRNTGGGLEADTVNAETKNAYLWFKPSNDLKLTLGIQGYTDDFKGVILGGADIAGIKADYTVSPTSSFSAGIFTFFDQDVAKSDAVYFIPLSYKQKIGNDTLTVAFYTIKDSSTYQEVADTTYGQRPLTTTTTPKKADYDSARIHYLGAKYEGKVSDVSYSVMGFYNYGTFEKIGSKTGPDKDISAFLFGADAAMKLGDGKVKAALLYASGDKSTTDYNGIVTGNQYSVGADLPLLQNDLYLILRTLDGITHSTAFFTDLNNGGLGATVVYATYDQNLSDKLNVQAALGYGKANEKNASNLTPAITEINAQAAYKFDKALTIKAALAYGILSDVKVGTADADNLYRAMLKFQYAF
ncbi:MAG: membrane protein [bacterium]